MGHPLASAWAKVGHGGDASTPLFVVVHKLATVPRHLPDLLEGPRGYRDAGPASTGTGAPGGRGVVDDLADATIYTTEHYEGEEHLNVGVGEDISIRELAELLAEVVGYEGGSPTTPRCPTGRRASSLTSPACATSDGSLRSAYATASRTPTTGTSRTRRAIRGRTGSA